MKLMNFKKLSAKELEVLLEKSLRKETQGLVETLVLLMEVDNRKNLHQGSLAEYLINNYKISETAAYQRVNAMKQVRELPIALKYLEEGDIHMSQLSELKRAISQKEAELNQKISTKTKLELLEAIKNKPHRETQKILAQKLDLNLHKPEKKTKQKDGSLHTQFTEDLEFQDLYELCQQYAAHALKQNHQDPTMLNTLKYIMNEYIKRHTPNDKKSEAKTITPKRRQEILKRDNYRCQHRDENETQCQAKRFLQVDHILSLWAGGQDTDDNLHTLCAFHNQMKYQKEKTTDVGGFHEEKEVRPD